MDFNLFERAVALLHTRLLAIIVIVFAISACDRPPTNEMIFINPPANTQFDTEVGAIQLSALDITTVCYTTDGSTPAANNTCDGGTSQLYQDSIEIRCEEEEVGDSISKEVRLGFGWPTRELGQQVFREALFFVNCEEVVVPDDTDKDGITDLEDNCPLVVNPNQSDIDQDNIGDSCDSDRDGDDVENGDDNCPEVFNPGQEDGDSDGQGTACDSEELNATDDFFVEFENLLNQLREIMQCKFNNCNTPDGRFNWSINAGNSDLEAGSASWSVGIESFFPPRGRMTLRANDAQLDGCVGNGSATGIFNTSGTGQLDSGQPIAFECDGLTGRAHMRLDLTEGEVTAGYYDVYCEQDECEDTAVRFRIIGTDENEDFIYSREVLTTDL